MNIRLDPTSEQFLDRLTATTERMDRAQRQISSGKRLTTVSDDPDQVSALLQSRLELETTEQIKQDLSRFKTEVDSAEGALNSAENLMERARTLAAQANSTFLSPENRTALATQIEGLLAQMVGIANTNVEGRYIFSGDSDSTIPYTYDPAVVPPYSAFAGSASTRQALAADGSRFPVARNASRIFENAGSGTNVFAALDNLRTAVLGGDQAVIETAGADVKSAGDHLRAEHAWYGAVQSRVNSAIDSASSRIVRFRSQIGVIEDADMTAAIVQFQEAKFQREAALQAHSQISRKSLFDYMG